MLTPSTLFSYLPFTSRPVFQHLFQVSPCLHHHQIEMFHPYHSVTAQSPTKLHYSKFESTIPWVETLEIHYYVLRTLMIIARIFWAFLHNNMRFHGICCVYHGFHRVKPLGEPITFPVAKENLILTQNIKYIHAPKRMTFLTLMSALSDMSDIV